jgi:uncharacterized protein YndB with AHSA1/START domain
MNPVITILVIVAGLVALVLIIAAFTGKDYSIYRSIIIDTPRAEVFAYIRHLKNQDHYSKWVMVDPNMKKSYRGTDGTVGFVYAWDGNKVAGKGEQEIKKITEGERIELEIRFERPFAGLARTPLATEAVTPGQTRVTWGMSSAMKYPMNAMLLFINMDKLLGKDLETSLSNLKANLER